MRMGGRLDAVLCWFEIYELYWDSGTVHEYTVARRYVCLERISR